jgi:hypothetical protein
VRILGGLAVLIAFFYVFYSGAMVVWSYFRVSEIIDTALIEHGQAGAPGVRESILRQTAAAGVRLHPEQALVSDDDERELSVHVRWAWPVIRYGGEDVLAIPLSIERTVARRR